MKITVQLLGGFRQYLPQNAKGDTIEVILENESSALDLANKMGIPKDLPKNILVNGRPFKEPPGEKLLNNSDVVAIFPYVVGG
ncbi:MAG: MoaD/ThiS family protein [Deltaproteobacteria bacterium]|nr:MoaD/ThiS family protein [Deltaproteobacteria bacterium]